MVALTGVSLFAVWVVAMRIRQTGVDPHMQLAAIFAGRAGGGAESPPSGLALPFAIEQIRAGDTSVNPFGLVRFSLDRPEYGHSGIDIPLGRGAVIFAVADGQIVKAQPADDGRPGQYVTLRITKPQRAGEAWIFVYEHVILDPGLTTGSLVKRGRRLGLTALETSYNNHFQLSYAFHAFDYMRNHTCWVDRLTPDTARSLRTWFSGLSAQKAFRDVWQTSTREGKHEFRALLDTRLFPGGPQLCYPPGTDARLPTERQGAT